ncbi:stage III sporulation protein AC [Sulfobacillus thermosulfidooxidans]|uniref:Stage III sporulation protein AC n=2 Tax=Sulfobacillus thermosulfidooxidans TaxID=28034 RepID=A0A1W1WK88_SULTA|nr:stage III sporulation protein AC [Sulfobacillus thermosulfidooxidans]OLZ08547.1 stage III sporulation protein AC [Sulfobacillus thermosulfidooxidans]OLZ13149.1 stage III sporulation protein AC [Sulfobacillus thermosulfidooxidans]OLZ21529.1 stage III sporulation protein AC [Sulfobacillus thermosulfidooxidans]PSR29224.1 MAG: stage III sporulation protein AC [Sulfobacillus thermosulfidooxidans]SMC06163.1 stage III sporulation protein AC [Sulfobacillus thermosulfidooxidans DSM 9293]
MTNNIDLIVRLAGIGILVTVAYSVLERLDRKEWGQLVALAGVAVGFLLVLREVQQLFNAVRTMFNL